MKKFAFYLLVLPAFCAITSCGGETDVESQNVPEIIITNFNSRYPGADQIKWTKEKKDGKMFYDAEFLLNGARAEVEYDEAGNFVKEEEENGE